jgi:hypothetical protein
LGLVEGSAPFGAGYQELDIVEGSTPSESDKEPVHVFGIRRAGNEHWPLQELCPAMGKRKMIKTFECW